MTGQAGRRAPSGFARTTRRSPPALGMLAAVEETPVAPYLPRFEHYIEEYTGQNTSSRTPRGNKKGRRHDP